MRKLISTLVLGMFGLAAGCGSDSTKTTDAGSDGGAVVQPDGGQSADAPSAIPDANIGSDDGATPSDGGAAAEEAGVSGPDGGLVASEGGTIGTDPDASAPADASADCSPPVCLAALFKDCAPEGTCVQQQSGVSALMCYANGVKASQTFNQTGQGVFTFKNAAGVCYQMEVAMGASSSTASFKDAVGTVVGTASFDGGNAVVTCTGGQPVALGAGCGASIIAIATGAGCTPGTCTF